jgi:hypothetical protein
MKPLLCPVCKLDLEPAHLAHICVNVWRDALWVDMQLLKEAQKTPQSETISLHIKCDAEYVDYVRRQLTNVISRLHPNRIVAFTLEAGDKYVAD